MALAEAPPRPILSPHQIIALADRRRQQYAERDGLYEVYNNYYRGKTSGQRPSVMAANSQGRPILRDLEGNESDRHYSTQILSPIIDDSQALLGRMPVTRVEPPVQSDAGVQKAELLTKYLVSTHELSRMDRQQAEIGFHLPCLGDGCYLLEPDPKLHRVTWTVVDPSTAYPSFMTGYRRFDLQDLAVVYFVDPYAARARWGSKVQIDDDKDAVPVTVYVSPWQRTVVVGHDHPVQVHHAEWDLGFCPAVWVFNKINGAFAQSDIASALVQQDALDYMMAIFLDGAQQNIFPIIGVKNPINVGSDPILVGPGAPPIPVQGDGDIIVRNSQGDLGAIRFGIQAFKDDIYAATGTTSVRQQGDMHSSIVTGRAMHAAQGPQATRVELKQQELGAAIRIANSMTLEMQEKAPFLGPREFEIFGRWKGQAFRETMSGKDIDGWYRNSVFWEPVTGMNLQQKTAVAYEGMTAGIWDDIRARELAGEEDPMGMRDRIRQQKMHDAQLQAQIQAVVGGGEGGQPPPGGSPGAPAGPGSPGSPSSAPTQLMRPRQLMPGGGHPQPPGAPQPGAPGPQGAPKPPGGVPAMGVTRDKVSGALAAVGDKLRGQVFALGQLAFNGTTSHLELAISEYKDHSLVLGAVKPLDPSASVKFVPEDKLPPEALKLA